MLSLSPTTLLQKDNTPTTQNRSIAHIPVLDGLRGLAILAVVSHHAMSLPTGGGGYLSRMIQAAGTPGWAGVDLFFVLSGFLITTILLRSRGQQYWLKSFYARRALRVLPLYYSVLAICFWIAPHIEMLDATWLQELSCDQLWYWLHGANFRRIESHLNPISPTVGWFSTFWSLAIEEQFYLIWPLAIIVFGRNLLRYSLIGVVIVTIMRWYSGIFGSDLLTYFHTATRLDGLLLGSALATYINSGKSLVCLIKPSKVILVAAGAAFSMQIFSGLPVFERSSYYGQLVLYSASSWGSVALLTLALHASTNGLYYRFLNMRMFTFAGKVSFGMYILNKPIIAGLAILVDTYLGPMSSLSALLLLIVAIALCMLAGWLSWICIEQPALSFKRYFPLGQVVEKIAGNHLQEANKPSADATAA